MFIVYLIVCTTFKKGWVNILLGGASFVISMTSGYVVKYIGSQIAMTMMLMGALIHCVFMISWSPNTQEGHYVVFLMAILFAFTNCLGNGQLRGLYGIYFSGELLNTAYSTLVLFETIGLTAGSVISIYFCTNIKVYIYGFLALWGLVSLVVLEMKTNYLIAKRVLHKDDNFTVDNNLGEMVARSRVNSFKDNSKKQHRQVEETNLSSHRIDTSQIHDIQD
jgi:hypothetical protein